MKKIFSTLLFSLILLFTFSTKVNTTEHVFGGASYEEKEVVSENEMAFGINHQSIKGVSGLLGTTPSNQSINILDVPNDDNLQIVTWAKISSSRWNMAPVRTIAEDYELNNPGYKVIAAINGDFFDINGTRDFPYATGGIHVANGENYKTTDNDSGSSREPIGFNNEQEKRIIGNKAFSRSDKMILTVYNGLDQFRFVIDKINQDPSDYETSLFYGVWNNRVPGEVEVTDSYIIKDAIYSLPHSLNDFYGKGYITNYGSMTVGEGDFAIKTNNQDLKILLESGRLVRVQYELTGDYAGLYYATGAGKPIIYDGLYSPDDTDFGRARHPRTMIGVKEDGSIVMMVVDGRQVNMAGVSQNEMAAIMNHYGVTEAYNLDGGGSSTMLILKNGKFEVVNSPSDNRERSVSNAILVVAKVPEIEIEASLINEDSILITSNLLNKNGYTFNDYYIGINDNIIKVENNQVLFEGLESNKEYTYKVYYEESDVMVALPIEGILLSAKKMPSLESVSFNIDDDLLVISINIKDIDKAIDRRILQIDNKNYTISDEGLVYLSDLDLDLSNMIVRLSYNLNDNNGKKELIHTEYRLDLNLHSYFYYTNLINKNLIRKIIN